MKEYAVYKGDMFLAMGTIRELAKELNMKESSVRYLLSPTQKKRNKGRRKIAILIDDEE